MLAAAPAFAGATVEQQGPLSLREGDVLDLIARGRSNKEIARILSIAPETVKADRPIAAIWVTRSRMRRRDRLPSPVPLADLGDVVLPDGLHYADAKEKGSVQPIRRHLQGPLA